MVRRYARAPLANQERYLNRASLQRVSYLDPPVRLDQLSELAQRCLLTVRLPRQSFV